MNYDAVMVTVAVSLYLCRALRDGFRFGDAILIVAAWSIELVDPPLLTAWALLTPFVYCLFLAAVIARGDARAPLLGLRCLRHFNWPHPERVHMVVAAALMF